MGHHEQTSASGAAQNRMATTCRDAIKAFATNQYRNKVSEKPEEAAHVKLYGQLPPITKMDPAALSTLKECKHLALSSNNIDKIGNLAGMEKLVVLSLGRNNIKKLENLDGLGARLEQLWISYNIISSLAGIEKLRVLKVLFISNNKISDFKEVNRLAELSSTLEEVVLFGNPLHMGIIGKDGELAWADQVLTALPTLKKLDGISAVDWRNKMDSGNEKELRDVFQLIDADGGGTLDQDELKFAVKDPKVAEMMGLDPVEIEFILVKILNSKGPDEEVTFEDFCYWFSNDQK